MIYETLESRRLMSVNLSNGVLNVDGVLWSNNLTVSQSGSTLTVNDNGNITTHSASSVLQLSVKGNGGNDHLSVAGVTVKALINGFGGHDNITGGQGNDTINGGSGNDVIVGGPLTRSTTMVLSTGTGSLFGGGYVRPAAPAYPDDDQINGGFGDDRLIGGIGADNILGGDGSDLADYSDRTTAVSVRLDGLANDGSFDAYTGASTELDNVDTTVENVQGGVGNDILEGSTAANTLFGEGGNDELYGLGGNDYLEGSTGDDWLNAGDDTDTVSGGDGNDTVYAGAGDDGIDGAAGNDWVSAGDGRDKVGAGAGNDTVYGGIGDDALDGMAGADTLYGDDGNDTLRGGDDGDILEGLAGNDTLYGGGGQDFFGGGAGDDLLISVGGGQNDYLHGDLGFDSFWVDSESTELVTDLSTLENQRGHMHKVGSFLPTTRRNDDGTVTTQMIGRDLTGPNLMDPDVFEIDFTDNTPNETPVYSDFGHVPLFGANGPKMDDVRQRAVGDCYFLAGLSAAADASPDRIRQSVVDLGDGTYGVQFFRWGAAHFVRVDDDLPELKSAGGLAYAQPANSTKWAAIMEKAWAFFRHDDGRYESIEGGTAGETFDALGCANNGWLRAPWQSASDWLEDIQDELNAGKAVTLSTGLMVSGELVGFHVYVVDHVQFDSSGQATGVVLRNPWGSDTNVDPDGDGKPVDGLHDGFLTVSESDVFWSNVIAHVATV